MTIMSITLVTSAILSSQFHRIELDGLWSLHDLYDFPRVHAQVYAFFYVIETPTLLRGDDFAAPFFEHPWVGGYDSVNFYHQLQSRVPRKARPDVVAIRYESPGWLDLSLLAGAAISIRIAVSSFIAAGERLNHLYTSIQRGIHDRKLARVDIKRKELELDRDQRQFARESGQELAVVMQFPHLEALRELTGDDLRTLKILLAHYRRVRSLARFQKNGQAKL